MLEAVIFDFDGVLVDTPTYYFRHMKKYLHSRNAPVTDDELSSLVGRTFDDKLNFITKKYSVAIDRNHFVEETSQGMKDEIQQNLVIDPCLKTLLNQLKENNVMMAIASSNVKKNIDFFITKLGIRDFFSAIVSFDDVEFPKPSPETYSCAVRGLSLDSSCCVAIEDTPVGIEAAKAAGLKVIGLPNKFTLEGDLEKADLVVKSFKELDLKTIKGLVE